MATIVIGGQASGIGKTSVICALIAAMPERRWTAIKITQCSHEGGGKRCDCNLGGAKFAIAEERAANVQADSSRYLAAGAMRSLWVRTLSGHLVDAMPRIHQEIARAPNCILESISVLEFLQPDLYALIVARDIADFKPSARRYLKRADAILMTALEPGHQALQADWVDELREDLERIPQFTITGDEFAPSGWVDFVRRKTSR